MGSQRFRGVIAGGLRDSAVIIVPFDPDQAWGAKADHPVSGTVGDCRIRTRLVPADGGWALSLAAKRLTSMGLAIGDEVSVELAPEGPQRGDLADDIATALAADPAAGAFFDTLAQFYRKAYLRWIDSTTRRPELRAARIAEVVSLLAAGVKERRLPRFKRLPWCSGWYSRRSRLTRWNTSTGPQACTRYLTSRLRKRSD
jgi:hypothetical protein